MKTKRLLLALVCTLLPAWVFAQEQQWITYEPKPGPGAGKHVVFLTGDEEYRSEEGLPMLAKIVSQRHGFKATVLFAVDPDGTINPNNLTSLPGAEALDSADAIVMLTRFRQWPEDAMKHFADAVNRGVPIVGLRTATHAFKGDGNKLFAGDFGKNVLGEKWVNHWGKHKAEATRGIIEPSAVGDPILNGVTDIFGLTDVYEAYPPEDAKILARGQVLKGMTPDSGAADYMKKRSTDKAEQGVNDPMMPIAWTREYKGAAGKTNRVLTTTMGDATDLENESLRRLVVNGIYAGLGLPVPAKADVAYVDPYKPGFYSAGAYRKGIKPSDHALGKTLPGEPNPKPGAAPDPNAVRVACVGDSITQGSGAGAGQSYPAQLQALLGSKWAVGNFGVSGRTLLKKGDYPYWKEKAFENALASKPHAVVIMLGTNDTKPQNWKFKDEFAADYRELVTRFQQLESKPRVFICRPVPVPEPGNFGINEAGIQEQMPILDALAKELGAGIIDMHAALDGKASLLPDHVHPNTAGAGEMAKAAAAVLIKAVPTPAQTAK